ncbi:MAG: pyruvate-ferredoxin/flavodoxin oxidoreductase, partial [Bacteroidota bacterium]|nr:pyruvate-ferredoxin/flavodoxin oxidoreductase [Bacteroidota bacterium]
WLLYRYHPDNPKIGKNPLTLDSKQPKIPVAEYLNMEIRFRMLHKTKPELAKLYYEQAQKDVNERYSYYKYLADRQLEISK